MVRREKWREGWYVQGSNAAPTPALAPEGKILARMALIPDQS